jgi:putative peptidoglycan lipid II flippase
MSLGRAIFTIGGWTMASRVVGLAREMLVADYLGAGMVADAFMVAFRFPNLFRSLFAEGAFNPAFVPQFAAKLEGEGRDAAKVFAEQAYAVLGLLVGLFVIIMEIAMPWAIYGLAPGFDDIPGKIELAAELSRITFPYLFFISLVSLQSGVLNAMGRFAAAAGTPVLLSLTSMALLVALAPISPTVGHAAAWGVMISGISQFAWLLYSMRRAAISLRIVRPVLTPEVKTLLRKVVPGAVGAGVYQLNLVINTIIASTVANGAVSFLNYADRLNQLPLGVVGIAIGTALLPTLTRQLRAGDLDAATRSQNRAMEFGLLLALPAAFALSVLGHPIIAVLFEHGAFTAADTDKVAPALAAFSAGLPAYVLIKVVTPSFFARHDTRTPVRIAMIAMALNVALNLILMVPLKHVGMALATAIAAWVNLGLLGWHLHRLGHFSLDARLKSRAARIVAACIVMSAALWAAQILLAPVWHYWRLLALALFIAIGLATYGAAILLSGTMTLAELRADLRRKPD